MRLVVVGSGIVGASCAFAATRLGADVTLVDAGMPGQATAAGAGIICPWTSQSDSHADSRAWYDLSCTAARNYPQLIADLAAAGETDVRYRRVGALVVGDDDNALDQACQRLQARQASTPEMGDIDRLDAAQAQRLFPPLAAADGTMTIRGAVRVAGGARIDGRHIAAAMARAAERAGAVRRPGQATLACEGSRVRGVTVGRELIEADAVIAATGAWTTSFTAAAGLTVPVSPQRGQIVHISVAPADTRDWPVLLPQGSDHYLLAFDDSRVVAGATRETGSGFDVRVTPAGLADVLRQALAVAPGLAHGTHVETRVGLRPTGPDPLPLLGPVPGLDGLVMASGLGANGLTLGPYSGEIAARTALGLDPGVDLTPFSPLRGTG